MRGWVGQGPWRRRGPELGGNTGPGFYNLVVLAPRLPTHLHFNTIDSQTQPDPRFLVRAFSHSVLSSFSSRLLFLSFSFHSWLCNPWCCSFGGVAQQAFLHTKQGYIWGSSRLLTGLAGGQTAAGRGGDSRSSTVCQAKLSRSLSNRLDCFFFPYFN